MSILDENWSLHKLLGMSWKEASALEGDERTFLLEKATGLEVALQTEKFNNQAALIEAKNRKREARQKSREARDKARAEKAEKKTDKE